MDRQTMNVALGRGRACATCFRAKAKCDRPAEGAICQRCVYFYSGLLVFAALILEIRALPFGSSDVTCRAMLRKLNSC